MGNCLNLGRKAQFFNEKIFHNFFKEEIKLFNLNPAYNIALRSLAGMLPDEVAWKASVHYDLESRLFTVPFLGTKYFVSFPDGEITTEIKGEKVPMTYGVIILHYLIHAGGCPLTGRYITFKELPGGSIYVEPFNNRAIRPLLSVFGNRPHLLFEAGQRIGGVKAEVGDWAVTIKVLPMVPITFVIWEGDQEFLPSGNILYDASAICYLETEDYALLPGLAIFEMKKIASL